MMDFILNYYEAVAGVILAGVLIIYALVTRQWSILQVAALRLMLDAERLMATKEGIERMDAVSTAVWQKVPKWLKRFVSEKTLRKKLQNWYNIAKNSLGGDRSETTEPTT
jgi:hypothetical protein